MVFPKEIRERSRVWDRWVLEARSVRDEDVMRSWVCVALTVLCDADVKVVVLFFGCLAKAICACIEGNKARTDHARYSGYRRERMLQFVHLRR